MKFKIPKSFTIHGHLITIKEVEFCEDAEYGYYDSTAGLIVIAHKINRNGKIFELTPIQIEHTFYHEVIHVFQYHSCGEFNEIQAQTWAGLLLEFIHTSDIVISPNTIYVPLNKEEDEQK